MVPSPLDLIKGTPFSDYTSTITKLTGGYINHVWRVTNNKNGKSVIVKYAGKTMAALPEAEFSVERMEFEAKGLALFGALPDTLKNDPILRAVNELGKKFAGASDVHLPRLLYYDRSIPFVVIEDLGDLKSYEDWCIGKDVHKAEQADIEFVCKIIGQWIACLHGFGYENFSALKPYFTNTPARDALGDVFYNSFCSRIVEHTAFADRRELADIVREFKAEITTLADCSEQKGGSNPCTLLFGDLWSGSVLFDKHKRIVNLIDLEFADIGLNFGDVAHFVAHLWPVHFLRHPSYNPNTDPYPSHVVLFLKTYAQTLKAEYPSAYSALIDNGNTVRQMNVFFGAEVARDVLTGYWCRCGKGKTEKDMPIKCICADTLLPFTRRYIRNGQDSVFSILLD
ncbi:kinase-like domain-containing protein [Coemansia spiralis]|nr:kinase-like domain-containing protein [Coemansia spiralis]